MIEDWAPKAEEEEIKTNKTRKRVMSFESNKDENSDEDKVDIEPVAVPEVDSSQVMVKQMQKAEQEMLKNEIEQLVGAMVTKDKPSSQENSKK